MVAHQALGPQPFAPTLERQAKDGASPKSLRQAPTVDAARQTRTGTAPGIFPKPDRHRPSQ